jgi:hypothetical protein
MQLKKGCTFIGDSDLDCNGYKREIATPFFHVVATQRRRINRILTIQNSLGQQIKAEKEVCHVFYAYFKN